MYNTVHGPELVTETLAPEKCLGSVKPGSLLTRKEEKPVKKVEQDNLRPKWPPLGSIVNVDDFEKVAQSYLDPTGWAYYSSGAEDELSLQDTRRLFRRTTFRPRVLRRVEPVSPATSILGRPSSLPFYISPTGIGRYAHAEAEQILARVAGKEGIIYCMPSAAPHETISSARVSPEQPLFLQLYANRDRAKSEALIRKAEALGAAAVFLTVDSPVLGRRERDDRLKVAEGEELVSAGVAKTSSSGLLNPLLTWEDVDWLRRITSLPLVIKGIQTVEDALVAYDHGVRGVVLSNHGGRSLDTAQAPLLTLFEIRKHAPHLLSRDVRGKFQVFIDGGIRRGTDVLKALALGASAVGIGRPFLYALTAEYGEAGVTRLVQMFRAEIETSMALVGAASVDDLVPEMINSERAENEMSRRVKL
ncbi:putative cytochrome b2 protein [Eutypa lata UCREL1]|uniref:Putative cytochrome b2 protein n=1 Tax=Eutypa lata (strain UCR-EL1) TaxID=1287681 RepID=M7TC74_EUTLA|nr:putative cytochrome b2 protein [Eutypa lata UCREL1]